MRSIVESTDFEVKLGRASPQPTVKALSVALHQCLTNLLSNALEYGKTGGWIKVETITTESDRG